MNQLEQLKQYTTVVADTGNFQQLAQFKPQDATTNPSLILKAVLQPEYLPLLRQTAQQWKSQPLDEVVDRLLVRFGCEILAVVPGRVSTEVDARLSFDTEATVTRAERLIALYQAAGVHTDRVLIKIAATWEGIEAARRLEQRGIRTNLTLLFSKVQAIACAEAGVQLISPFVGRILDWHKANLKVDHIPPAEDPGVLSVTEIFHYYKHFGYATEVMGASFRNTGEIIELAGCDLLTIAPSLLSEFEKMEQPLSLKLNAEESKKLKINKILPDEKMFRWLLNEDAMATEKLAEGIRKFAADLIRLEQMIAPKL